MKPIFLISLPRSGSTLLQRVLMGHSAVASKSEPWLMLPLIYMRKADGLVSEYNHRLACRAMQQFTDTLPNQEEDYREALHEFAMTLYRKHATHGEQYFLDKTPRYYLIIPELVRIFPEAKFIFLVRNPLQVIASMISSFTHNTLNRLHFFYVDLYKGMHHMATGISTLGDNALTIRYEDLINHQEATLEQVFRHLNLDWSDQLVAHLDDRGLNGTMGDKTGVYQYDKINKKTVNKWKQVLNEGVRKHYVRSVIESIDDDTLSTYGYDKALLLSELKQLRAGYSLQGFVDAKDIVASRVISTFYLNLYRQRVKGWSKNIILS